MRTTHWFTINALLFLVVSTSSCSYTIGPATGSQIAVAPRNNYSVETVTAQSNAESMRLFVLPPLSDFDCNTTTRNNEIIHVEGIAPVIENDILAAREEAITDALIKAIERYNGVYINGTTLVSNGSLLSSDVESRYSGFVSAYEVASETRDSNFYRVQICTSVKPTVPNSSYSYGITQSDNVEIHYEGEDCVFAGKSLSDGLLTVGISSVPYGGNVKVFFQCGEIEKGIDAVTGFEVISTFFSIRAERTVIRGDICNISQTRIAGVGKTASSAMENMAWNGDLQIKATLLRYCTAVPVELSRLRITSPETAAQPEIFLNRIKSIRWTRKTEVRSIDDYTMVVDIYSSLPSPVFSRRLSLVSGVNILREDNNIIDMYYSASQVSSSLNERWR
ncbi:MAG TPA: flagellar assembly protein T N-terminal domain-containing protein [Alphaproteobacteria bacterium]|nr:flagellar assembly protein T N-terminal domain-containing protein [Alphaproteobacteria bacterium]